MQETIEEILARTGNKNPIATNRNIDVHDTITRIYSEEGADPNLGLAMARQEGGRWDTKTSGAGAQGPLQVIPSTGLHYVSQQEWDTPEGKVRAAARYTKDLSNKFNNDPYYITAAYHAGEGKVKPYYERGEAIPRSGAFYDRYAKIYTNDHVDRVLSNYQGKRPVGGIYGGNTVDDILDRVSKMPAPKPSPPPQPIKQSIVQQPISNTSAQDEAKQLQDRYESKSLLGKFGQDILAGGYKGIARVSKAVDNTLNLIPGVNIQHPGDQDIAGPVIQRLNTEVANSPRGRATRFITEAGVSAAPSIAATSMGIPAPLAFGTQAAAENLDKGWKEASIQGGKAAAGAALMGSASNVIKPFIPAVKQSIATQAVSPLVDNLARRLLAGGYVGTSVSAVEMADQLIRNGKVDFARAAEAGIPMAILTALMPGRSSSTKRLWEQNQPNQPNGGVPGTRSWARPRYDAEGQVIENSGELPPAPSGTGANSNSRFSNNRLLNRAPYDAEGKIIQNAGELPPAPGGPSANQPNANIAGLLSSGNTKLLPPGSSGSVDPSTPPPTKPVRPISPPPAPLAPSGSLGEPYQRSSPLRVGDVTMLREPNNVRGVRIVDADPSNVLFVDSRGSYGRLPKTEFESMIGRPLSLMRKPSATEATAPNQLHQPNNPIEDAGQSITPEIRTPASPKSHTQPTTTVSGQGIATQTPNPSLVKITDVPDSELPSNPSVPISNVEAGQLPAPTINNLPRGKQPAVLSPSQNSKTVKGVALPTNKGSQQPGISELQQNPPPPIQVPVKPVSNSQTQSTSVTDKPSPQLGQAQKIDIPKNIPQTVEEHFQSIGKFRRGEMTADETRSIIDWLSDPKNEEIVKQSLKSKTIQQLKRNFSFWHNTTKGRYVDLAYDQVVRSYTLGDSFTQSMNERTIDAVKRKAANLTDEQIQEDVAKRKAKIEADKKALTNPETKEELDLFVRKKGFDALTPEQLAKYDELQADSRRGRDKEQAEKQSIVQRIKDKEAKDVGMEIVKHFHTKRNQDVYIVKLDDRVSRDAYNELVGKAKKLGGWYSKKWGNSPSGFAFTNEDTAKQFIGLKAEDADSTATQEDKSRSNQERTVNRLLTVAESTEQRADTEITKDRKVNTMRRAGMAEGILKQANKDKALAQTIRNNAELISNNEAKHLQNISAKSHVETLETLLNRAKSDHATASGERWDEARDREPNEKDIQFAKIPDFETDSSTLNYIARNLAEIPGGKRLAQTFQKYAKASKKIKVPRQEVERAVKVFRKYGKEYQASWWAEHSARLQRLEAMDIKSVAELRAALREYLITRQSAQKEDPVKKLERDLIGRNIPGYFPTPKALVERLVDEADIKPGMDVLEPSAGKGNIADQILKEHSDIDLTVVEYNSTLREVLEAKGYKPADYNFIEHKGKYDRIIMNPPFEDGQDIDHVKHAYELLKPGGRVVAIMSSGPFYRSDKKATAFREWLDKVEGQNEKLPTGSFKESERSTGAATHKVVIDKPIDKQPEQFQQAENDTKQENQETDSLHSKHSNDLTVRKQGGKKHVSKVDVSFSEPRTSSRKKYIHVSAQIQDGDDVENVTLTIKQSRQSSDVYELMTTNEKALLSGDLRKIKRYAEVLLNTARVINRGDQKLSYVINGKGNAVVLTKFSPEIWGANHLDKIEEKIEKELKTNNSNISRNATAPYKDISDSADIPSPDYVKSVSKGRKTDKTGFTPSQKTFLIESLKLSLPDLARGQKTTINIPEDGQFTLSNIESAERLVQKVKGESLISEQPRLDPAPPESRGNLRSRPVRNNQYYRPTRRAFRWPKAPLTPQSTIEDVYDSVTVKYIPPKNLSSGVSEIRVLDEVATHRDFVIDDESGGFKNVKYPTILMNDAAAEILREATGDKVRIGRIESEDHGTQAILFTRDQIRTFSEYLRAYPKGKSLHKLKSRGKRLELFADTLDLMLRRNPRQRIFALIDGSDIFEDEFVQTLINHEIGAHGWQYEVIQEFEPPDEKGNRVYSYDLLGNNLTRQLKWYEKAHDGLKKLGYADHPEIVSVEAIAYILDGRWMDIGFKFVQANEFLEDYLNKVASIYGGAALNRLTIYHPKLRRTIERIKNVSRQIKGSGAFPRRKKGTGGKPQSRGGAIRRGENGNSSQSIESRDRPSGATGSGGSGRTSGSGGLSGSGGPEESVGSGESGDIEPVIAEDLSIQSSSNLPPGIRLVRGKLPDKASLLVEKLSKLLARRRITHHWNNDPINIQFADVGTINRNAEMKYSSNFNGIDGPAIYGNESATAIINDALEWIGEDSGVDGIVTHVQTWTQLAYYVEARRDLTSDEQEYSALDSLLQAMRLFMDENSKAPAVVYINAPDSRVPHKTRGIQRHEFTHFAQRIIAAWSEQSSAMLVDPDDLKTHPDFKRISRMLWVQGYPALQGKNNSNLEAIDVVGAEAIAFIFEGQAWRVGYFGKKGRERAAAFVTWYLTKVVEKHGIDTLYVFESYSGKYKKDLTEVRRKYHEQQANDERRIEKGDNRETGPSGSSLSRRVPNGISKILRGGDGKTRDSNISKSIPKGGEGESSRGSREISGREGSTESSSEEFSINYSRAAFSGIKKAFGLGEIKDTLKALRDWSRESLDDVRKIINPTARGLSAEQTAHITRERAAELARKSDIAYKKLEEASKLLGKLDQDQQRAFIHAIETDAVNHLPTGLQRFAILLRQILDSRRQEVQNLGTGKLQTFYRNYFPHIWKDPMKAASTFHVYFGKRPFEGSKSFLKQRTIPTIEHGIAMGLEPVTYNPVDLVLLKVREMDRYIMAHKILEEMKNTGLLMRIKATHRVPDGWAKIDDKVGTIYGAPVRGAMTIRGHWIAPDPAANIINNYLSPGIRGFNPFRAYLTIANVLNQFQLGLSFFHFGFTSLDAAISKMAFGLQQLSYGKPIAAAKSLSQIPIAPITNILQGRKVYKAWEEPGSMGPEWDAIVKTMQAGGGRVKMDSFYATEMTKKMIEAFSKKNIPGAVEGVFRALPALMEQLAKPLMEYLVPRQKLGVFADLARLELEKLGPNASQSDIRKVMAKVWDSVDNRMGQLVYDNLFWHKTFKDLLMASVRSVGWNLGTKREVLGGAADFAKWGANWIMKVGGGGKLPPGGKPPVTSRYGGEWFSGRPEFTYRMGYIISLTMVTGMVGAMITYLMTGEEPKETKDYFFPRTGAIDEHGRPQRLSLPTYIKDIYHYSEDPGRTAVNKLHPALAIMGDIFSNEDFYGTKVWNEDDPPPQQIQDVLTYMIKSLEPFSVRGYREEKERKSNVPAIFPFIGLTPAPASIHKTRAEKLADELLSERVPVGSRTKEETERAKTRRGIVRGVRLGQDVAPEIESSIKAGKLSPSQIPGIYRKANTPGLVWSFNRLDLNDALKVWDKASKQERDRLLPLLRKKMSGLSGMPEELRGPLLERSQKALNF